MVNMLSIFFIGFALSMDAFSLTLGLGTTKIKDSLKIKISTIIGLFHFLFPLIGQNIGKAIIEILHINSHVLMIIIFIYIGIMMQLNNKSSKRVINFNILNIIILAIGVSMDSLVIGVVLSTYSANPILSAFIFALCSGTFSYAGFILGEYSIKYLNEKAPLMGAITLYIIAIVNIIEQFF